jgi:S1-C subfamily serine protease
MRHRAAAAAAAGGAEGSAGPPEQPRSLTEKINGSIGLVLALRDMSAVCPRAGGMRVWVKRVQPNSPAADSAIRPGHELQGIRG